MVEDELRRSFHNHEHLVPDASGMHMAIAVAARRHRVRRRVLGAGGLAVLVLVALAIPTGIRVWGNHSAHLLPPASGKSSPLDGRPLNFLIAGLDDYKAHGGASDHADTIIVAHVPADRSRLYLITIPRETWVNDGSGGHDWVGHTYGAGGFAGLARAVGAMTGLTFDGAATVGLSALARLTDAVGGVDFCVDYAVTSWHTGQRFEAGCRHFTGAQATDYLRERINYINLPATDPARGEGGIIRDRHQVDYLRAVLAKLTANGVLNDPSKIFELFGTAGAGLVVDTGGQSLLDVAATLRPALRTVVGVATPYGKNVVYGGDAGAVFSPQAAQLFVAVRADQLATWLSAHPDAQTTH